LAEAQISDSKKAMFEHLVKKNMKRAYFVALGFLGSHDAAIDISQEAFIKAYKNFNKYDSERNFFTWYYKILKNLCLIFIRNSKNRKEERYLEYKNEELKTENPAAEFEKKDLIELMQKTLLEMDADDREIIVLKELANYSYKEIAEMLQIPVGTVMSRLFYARKKLSERFKRKI